MRRTILNLSVCGFGLIGCLSACGEEVEGGGAVSIPITELPAKYAGALCAAYSSCIGPLLPIFLNGEDCTTRTRRRIDDELPNLEAAVTAGKATYNGTKLQACVDKLAGMGCAAINQRDSDECVAAFIGTVAGGGDCTMDAECVKGNFCKSDLACPGKCTARQAAGAVCKDDAECVSGLSCDAGKCQTPGAAAAPCGGANDPECAPGLFCVEADDQAMTSGQCRTNADVFAGNVGDACDPSKTDFCASANVCAIDSISVVTGTVVAKCAATVGAGAACKAAFPSQCPGDEYCKLSGAITQGTAGVCTKKPINGENCATDGLSNTTLCAPYATCNQAKKCVDMQRVGGSCEDGSICYSETCLGGKCVAGDKCN